MDLLAVILLLAIPGCVIFFFAARTERDEAFRVTPPSERLKLKSGVRPARHIRRLVVSDDADSNIVWEPPITPPQSYRVEYADRHGEFSERDVVLVKIGRNRGRKYLGVIHEGVFKSFRADRVLKVTQISEGHIPAFGVMPSAKTFLPAWHEPTKPMKVPQLRGTRHWTIDLARYTCTCPDHRMRRSRHEVGTLGAVCPHLAKAIVAQLPETHAWDGELLEILENHDPLAML